MGRLITHCVFCDEEVFDDDRCADPVDCNDRARQVWAQRVARVAAEVRERCAKLCDTEAAISSGSRPTARALARKIKAGA